ncbi:hypothetical protein [Motiliproteus sp. MSK22-1]|uniref:hypothetical protein n=1 Tax=Motiliproteus sp. MSK22-1 TaxID=1897630 RepID=UPI001300EB63|nr:hypothetical protein [Motiliproteus sp. MSK22-1]
MSMEPMVQISSSANVPDANLAQKALFGNDEVFGGASGKACPPLVVAGTATYVQKGTLQAA